MSQYPTPAPYQPTYSNWLLLSALLWVVALLTLSGIYITLNASIEGPPASAEVWMPVGVLVLVGWLYGLIRRL